MSLITEVAYITLKPSISLSDSSPSARIWQDTLSTIRKQEGHIRAYWGITMEDEGLCLLFIDWQSLSSHTSFMASPIYTAFVSHLSPILSSSPEKSIHFHHYTPLSPTTALTEAPCIEFATFYNASSSLLPNVGTFIDNTRKEGGKMGMQEAVWGESLEDGVVRHKDFIKRGEEGGKKEEKEEEAKAVILCIGWESKDAHMRFRETEVFETNIHLLRGNHGGVEMYHVGFTEDKGK